VSEHGEGIILKIYGSKGNDSTVSSEMYKACSDNKSHENQLMVFPKIVIYVKVRSRLARVYNKLSSFICDTIM
jgi:hypothetical protein